MAESDVSRATARLVGRLGELAAITEIDGELTRRFATPALARAGELVVTWLQDAGMTAYRDAIGNVVGRYEGTESGARALVLGSHLDTVPNGGRLDGALGVLCGVTAVEVLAAAGERLPFAVEVVGFADEEGVRYGTAYLGSSTFAGSFDPSLLDRIDDDGIAMAEAIRGVGGDPAAIASGAREPGELLGYIEVHIEQGPVLEAEGLPVGIVGAIAGQSRLRAVLAGEAGHAGTVPMSLRRDALAGAAEVVLAVEALARAEAGLVATVGDLTVEPGAGNVVPGRVVMELDVRHADDTVRGTAVKRLTETAAATASARGLGLEWEQLLDSPTVETDGRLTAALAVSIEAVGLPVRQLVSGAGHDAAVVATITPVALLFVRCLDGVSHNPAESATESDIGIALDVLVRTVRRLASGDASRLGL